MFIDSSVGRDTEFVFSYSGYTFPLSVVVTSPNGRNYTGGPPDDVTKQMTISLNITTEVMPMRYRVVYHFCGVVWCVGVI